MDFITISENKLKVMLTAEDLESFDLSTEDLDYHNTETKRMFWDILGRAKHSIGFDTDGQRVLVQIYPSRSGGCEMFVTKIGASCSSGNEVSPVTELQTVLHCEKDSFSSSKIRFHAFGFDTLERLLCVCRRLSLIGYEGRSEAYMGDDDRSYLFLSGLDPSGFLPLDEFSFICEYGTPENTDRLRRYVGEHATEICTQHAVDILSVF